jgi:sucrose-phosphate synthase
MRILMLSLHGLFRGSHAELGRDADNGGQISYVMELARSLSQRPEIEHIHLMTRRIDDPSVGPDYAVPIEAVNDKFDIRRIWCGGKKYLPKEQLWDHLDEFVNNAIGHIKTEKIYPQWIHSHYADAGYVAMELSAVLNVPYCHTAHSLGRPKLEKMLESGLEREKAMERFAFEQRFSAEEMTLVNSEFLITSTEQEVRSYKAYQYSDKAEYHVIAPGLDFQRFYPYYDDHLPGSENSLRKRQAMYEVSAQLDKFFTHPERPMILSICRPDKKKNIDGLIHAYGTDPELQAMANLAVFAGIRSDIATMPPGEKEVLTEILLLMDKYNLYGKIAIPKKHDSELDVPMIYRLCARKRGVFANLALTEPFGLTLLEATACGCPVVATSQGGPAEIVQACENGFVVDPTDTPAIQTALKRLITDEECWRTMSATGLERVHSHYSWDAHVSRYLQLIHDNRSASEGLGKKNLANNPKVFERLKVVDRMFVTDIDGTLIDHEGPYDGLERLKSLLAERGDRFAFAVASGRSLKKIREILTSHGIPTPDVVIGSVGTSIHYGLEDRFREKVWERHIDYGWDPESVRLKLRRLKWLELQSPEDQNPFKVSYVIRDPATASRRRIEAALGPKLVRNCNLVMSHSQFLDILPNRASKGRAVRYLCAKWSIPMRNVIVSGDSGNDLDMFTGMASGIVVGNGDADMEPLRGVKRVYFAESRSAAGILEGLEHFRFLDRSSLIADKVRTS